MKQDGFTLVEMLVALAAMSLVAGAGVMMTDFGTRTEASIEARRDGALDVLRLRAALQSDLGQAAVRRVRASDGEKPQTALRGPPQLQGEVFLTLVRRGWDNPSLESRSNLQFVEYRLTQGRIDRQYRRWLDGAATEPPNTLISGVSTVRLEYMQHGQWLDAWAGSASVPLPDAVRLTIELDGRGSLSQSFLLPVGGRS